MRIQDYVSDIPRRKRLAATLGTSEAYLRQLASGNRKASVTLAKRIEYETMRMGPETVRKESLRPDIWTMIESPSLNGGDK